MTAPLRILHVDKFASRAGGGGTSYMLEILQRQRARGHEVELFASDGPRDVDTRLAHLHPPRPSFEPPPARLTERLATTATMVWSRRAERAMERALAEFRPDVVHCHNLYHQLSPSVLRPIRRAGIPIVMTMHDYKLVCPTYRLIDGEHQQCEACVGGSVRNVVARRCQGGSRAQSAVLMLESGWHRTIGAYDAVDRFLCPSAYLADMMRRGGFGERVVEFPNGYDLDSITLRTTTGRHVVFGGRLSWEKGVDHLIRAIALLDDVPLVVCGDGPQRTELEQLAERLVPGRVTFLGHVGRHGVLEQFALAAVVAVPSVWAENQPLTIIEAMACGVPVVSGNAPALHEMVRPGISGLAVDARDHAALATALTTFVDDPDLQRSIAVTARAHAEATHDMTRHLDALESEYLRLMPGGPPGRSERG